MNYNMVNVWILLVTLFSYSSSAVPANNVVELVESYRGQLKSHDEKASFDEFTGFIQQYNRVYENETELAHRFNVFKETLRRIESQKKQNPEAIFGINRFSDLTSDEFVAKYAAGAPLNSYKPKYDNKSSISRQSVAYPPPTTYDWREHNGVGPVKDQGECDSAYAFAAVGAFESQNQIHSGHQLSLSEQEIVSCSQIYGNEGCKSGSIGYALRYIEEKGIAPESKYPYVSGKSKVPETCQEGHPRVKRPFEVYAVNAIEAEILQKLYDRGPLIAHIDARPLQDYKGGVLHPQVPTTGWKEDHIIQLIGYGIHEIQYWLAKNSWGAEWGEQGFFRFARGENCLGVREYVFSVVIETKN